MGYYALKILNGTLKGKIFPIRSGLKIGRSVGDILLNDPSVSSLHAEIQVYPNKKIMIVDKDSKNKILIDGKPLIKSILEEGSKFSIGQIQFEMVPSETPEEIFIKFMKKISESIDDRKVRLKPFFHKVRVFFLSPVSREGRVFPCSTDQGFLEPIPWISRS